MARITKFEEKRMERLTLHKAIGATYTTFEKDGRRVLQIDSYGTEERKIPGKKSQSFQFDEDGARQLFGILKKHFDF